MKQYSPEEQIAIQRFKSGEQLNVTTSIADTTEYGYGELHKYGFWQFPLPIEFIKERNNEQSRK